MPYQILQARLDRGVPIPGPVGPPGPQGPPGPPGPGGGVQDEGVALTPRGALNFVGTGVTATDDPANNRITVTVSGGGGGGDPTSSFVTFPSETNPPVGMRNNYTATLGYRFTMTKPLTVTALGRLYAAGNSQDHFIGLWDADSHILLTSGTIRAATASDAHGYKNVTVSPVTITPGIHYTLGITETLDGDTWKDEFPLAGMVSSVVVPDYAVYIGTQDTEPTVTHLSGCSIDSPSMTFTEPSVFPGGPANSVQVRSPSGGFAGYSGLTYDGVTNLTAPGIDAYNPQGSNLGPPDDSCAFRFSAGSGLEGVPPGWPNLSGLKVQFRNWEGQNVSDNSAKTTQNMIEAFADYPGAGQRQLAMFYGNAAGYGDFQGLSVMHHYGGGMNAAGDEGVQCFRGDLRGGDPSLIQRSIAALAPTSSCNTTILDALSPATYLQVVRVASSAGFAVGDRVIIGRAFNPGGPELVVVQAVGSGTITTRIMQSHAAGATVTPSTGLDLGPQGNSFLGQFRLIRRVRTSGTGYYATGVVSNVSSPTFTGSGVAWSPTMVGGDAINPGCISLAVDDTTKTGIAMNPAWHQIRSVDSATTMQVQGANYYLGNADGNGSFAYKINFAARIMACEWVDYYTAGNLIWLDTPPSVGGWQVGDLIEQPASTDTHGIGMRIQIIPGTVQENRWAGARVENPSGVKCAEAFALSANPYAFTDPSKPGWETGLSMPYVGTAISVGGCRDYLILAYVSPGYPAMIYWPQYGLAKDVRIGPNTSNGSFRIETRWPGSGLELFNMDTSRTVTIDPSKTTVAHRTITIPDADGIINLLGPGAVNVFLAGAVGSFTNIGTLVDGGGATGAFNGTLFAVPDSQGPCRIWNITIPSRDAGWVVIQPATNTPSVSGNDYILEYSYSVATLTAKLRFRKTLGTGGISIFASLYITGSGGMIFTPDTGTSGTETSPTTWSMDTNVITESSNKVVLTNVTSKQATIDPTPLTAARTMTLPDASGAVLLDPLPGYASRNFANDAAAATGGIALGGLYHNAGALRVRVV